MGGMIDDYAYRYMIILICKFSFLLIYEFLHFIISKYCLSQIIDSKYKTKELLLELNKQYTFTAYAGHSQDRQKVTFKAIPVQLAGQGVFGCVYKLQTNIPEHKIMAVKIVLQDHTFRNRELSLLKHFQQENVLDLLYYFEIQSKNNEKDQVLYMFTDYYPLNLSQLIQQTLQNQRSIVPTVYVRLIMFQLLKALAYIHSYNCCHRDLKPENVFFNTQTLKVVVGDFGSAKIVSKDQQNISYICSRFFRAPELILGQCFYGVAPDIWSAGCILYELLTGEVLFHGADNKEMFLQMINVLGTPKQQDFDDMGLHQIKQSLKVVKPYKTTCEFMLRMLQYSPVKRATAEQLLTDKFFQPLYQCKNLINNQDKTEQMKYLIQMKQNDSEYLSQETIDYINKQQNIK